MSFVQDTKYRGEKGILFSFGPYQAVILPEIGGNLISFVDTERGYRFLREPEIEEMDSFRASPMVHGIPVLFPPNRYEDGTFVLNQKRYRFPVNEESTGNHLHGFFYNCPWEVADSGSSGDNSYVTVKQTVSPNHPAYVYFPHEFTISITYRLSNGGLSQEVQVKNEGRDAMPCMLGFHTAINAPFAADSQMKDMEFVMTIGDRWELNERMLPTGELQPLSKQEQDMKTGGVSPFFAVMDNHYTALPQNGKNFMALTDKREKVRLIYDVGVKYKQWMIWNKDGASGFFCPEPQTSVVNAPNLSLPLDRTGIVWLQPRGSWEETSRIYVEKI